VRPRFVARLSLLNNWNLELEPTNVFGPPKQRARVAAKLRFCFPCVVTLSLLDSLISCPFHTVKSEKYKNVSVLGG